MERIKQNNHIVIYLFRYLFLHTEDCSTNGGFCGPQANTVCQSRKGFESPDESGHEVRHDPDILASSPDRYKGR
jgi:hypothetical protein